MGILARFNKKGGATEEAVAVDSNSNAASLRSDKASDEGKYEADDEEKRVGGLAPGETTVLADQEPEYPTTAKLIPIVVALSLAVFCMALDTSIVSTAIPRITDDFHALNDVGWYGSAYLLTTCAFQLFYGKLYTFFSLKWVFLTAVLIFEIGSAVCGAAPSSMALIIGRAVAGLGAAGIFSGAILIVANSIPLTKRPAYMGILGAMYGLSSVIGPLLGGVFTSDVTWRWCFYINLPLGAVTMLFIVFFYHPPQSTRAQVGGNTWTERFWQLDPIGLIVFLPMIICLLLALQWGGTTYPWSNGRIIALFTVFGVLLVTFIAMQFINTKHATVPPRVMKQRSVAAGAFFTFCLGSTFFVFLYYVPIWFQAIKDYSPVASGIRNIPMVLSMVLMTIISGGIITATGYYTPWVLFSAVFMAIGAGLMSTWEVDTNSSKWIGYQIIFGFGAGAGIQQSLLAAQTVLPKKDVPIGTAIMMLFQLLGGAIFLSVGQNVFSNKLISGLQAAVPSINAEVVFNAGATGFRHIIPVNLYHVALVAYNNAIQQVFYAGTAMACLSFIGAALMEWKNTKGGAMAMG